jgi:hypothetical protein
MVVNDRFPHDTELDENFRAVVNGKTRALSRLLPYLAGITAYLLFLDISLWLSTFLKHSPLINILGGVFGFLVVIVGWFLAFLTFGLLGGNFSFSKNTFLLIKEADFRISVVVLLMSFFVARPVAGVISKANISYSAKIKLFWILLVTICIGFSVFCGFVNGMSENPGKYYFMYVLLGAIYSFIAGYRMRERPRTKFRFPNEYKQNQKESYSFEEFKKILHNL